MEALTPKEIVKELDRYIIGQEEAKRAVAIAIRNRWRRQHLPENLREEVAPKNILMIGPTGVGKTEIARRVASLVTAPFIKVEATRYTEVGYVGRDVESMVRDLVEISYGMCKARELCSVQNRARRHAEERLAEILSTSGEFGGEEDSTASVRRIKARLRRGELDNTVVEIPIEERPFSTVELISNQGVEQMGINFEDLLDRIMPRRTTYRKATVKEALELLTQQEAEKLVDEDNLKREAVQRTEQMGIIFLDELDKIAGPSTPGAGPDVSREGVQRDLLPIIEGATVMTRYGMVRTDHILFIAAGAFHIAKPSDLIPELQGRLPIRVQLSKLTEADFVRILTEPDNALTKQYEALLRTENVEIDFTDQAIREIARIASEINSRTEDIGARRLQTVMEKLLEEISFEAPDLGGRKISIDKDYVLSKLSKFIHDEDLSRYIL